MMMMMMMNCFCGIFSLDHCQKYSPSPISEMQPGFKPVQNLSSSFIEWNCAVVITTTSRSPNCHYTMFSVISIYNFKNVPILSRLGKIHIIARRKDWRDIFYPNKLWYISSYNQPLSFSVYILVIWI